MLSIESWPSQTCRTAVGGRGRCDCYYSVPIQLKGHSGGETVIVLEVIGGIRLSCIIGVRTLKDIASRGTGRRPQ
jgi:hypothetical protein